MRLVVEIRQRKALAIAEETNGATEFANYRKSL
jgi:hypothetical protein